VILALPALLAKFPGIVYRIIGTGEDRRRLEALAKAQVVEHVVQFAGWAPEEDLPREFHGCEVFVLPSAKEGFGFVFMEAMAHGRPVFAARAGATPEVVADVETGLLVPYGDVAALKEALTRLLGWAALRRQMGVAGIERVRDEFALPLFAQRWLALF